VVSEDPLACPITVPFYGQTTRRALAVVQPGAIRILWVVPRLGARTAELMEQPIMVGVSIFAARWVVRRLGILPLWPRRLAMGCIALGLMLLAEFTVVLWVRGLTLRGYLESRDPVSGAAYFIALGAFAVMAVFVRRQPDRG
jgi:hypothetical protein